MYDHWLLHFRITSSSTNHILHIKIQNSNSQRKFPPVNSTVSSSWISYPNSCCNKNLHSDVENYLHIKQNLQSLHVPHIIPLSFSQIKSNCNPNSIWIQIGNRERTLNGLDVNGYMLAFWVLNKFHVSNLESIITYSSEYSDSYNAFKVEIGNGDPVSMAINVSHVRGKYIYNIFHCESRLQSSKSSLHALVVWYHTFSSCAIWLCICMYFFSPHENMRNVCYSTYRTLKYLLSDIFFRL